MLDFFGEGIKIDRGEQHKTPKSVFGGPYLKAIQAMKRSTLIKKRINLLILIIISILVTSFQTKYLKYCAARSRLGPYVVLKIL
jgi:type IV secretory pathway TrbF-like protein